MLKALIACAVLSGGLFAQETEFEWTRRVEPVYPQMARIAHIQGEVFIQAEVDPAGNIVAVRPISGHPILIAAASDSLKRSKISCRNCDGKNAAFTVRYVFKMDGPVRSNPCFDKAGNALPCGNGDPLRATKVRSPVCLYLWKCAAAAPAQSVASSGVTSSQTQRTLVPAGVGFPTRPGRVAALHP